MPSINPLFLVIVTVHILLGIFCVALGGGRHVQPKAIRSRAALGANAASASPP